MTDIEIRAHLASMQAKLTHIDTTLSRMADLSDRVTRLEEKLHRVGELGHTVEENKIANAVARALSAYQEKSADERAKEGAANRATMTMAISATGVVIGMIVTILDQFVFVSP